ncbi:M56 family metallopeptidase [Bacillus sp. FSL L8-0199]|uniref:M56 family metallopeptidase n=1 Tax=Bacillus sp. FSL L8-0199 TaxID=2954616 RepID=UPI002E241B0C|nr:M56 family metallopeptidase [Bacillus thuringiensis]
MNEWLKLLTTLTVAGSTVVICMLLIKPISLKFLSANWQYLIGKLALLFYTLPFVCIIHIFPSLSPTMIAAYNPIESKDLNKILSEQNISMEMTVLIFTILTIGSLLSIIWYICCYKKFVKEIKKSSLPVPESHEVYKLFCSCKQELGIKKQVQLAYNYKISTPALVGLWKPTLLLPIEQGDNVELSMVIRHELIHFKSKDLWIKMFTLVVISLHWFNPLVYVLRKHIHTWSEFSCDEKVVVKMTRAERKRYGETILNMLENTPVIRSNFSVSLSGTRKNLERRLTMLLNAKKVKTSIVVITTIGIIAIGYVGITTSSLASKNIPIVSALEVKEAKIELDNPKNLESNSSYELISVKKSDENRFRPEVWKDILSKIDSGEITWEDE